jgi:hypothetical protein
MSTLVGEAKRGCRGGTNSGWRVVCGGEGLTTFNIVGFSNEVGMSEIAGN